MLNTKREIKEWLDENGVENYFINADLIVDVNGYADLSRKNLTEIPIQFGIIGKDFNCSFNNLVSLKGCPYEVRGSFICMGNKIASIDYCPKVIKNNLIISRNEMTSLKGFDSQVGGVLMHGYFVETPFKIAELDGYYKEDKFSTEQKLMTATVFGRDLSKIISYFNLKDEISTPNEKKDKRHKI